MEPNDLPELGGHKPQLRETAFVFGYRLPDLRLGEGEVTREGIVKAVIRACDLHELRVRAYVLLPEEAVILDTHISEVESGQRGVALRVEEHPADAPPYLKRSALLEGAGVTPVFRLDGTLKHLRALVVIFDGLPHAVHLDLSLEKGLNRISPREWHSRVFVMLSPSFL